MDEKKNGQANSLPRILGINGPLGRHLAKLVSKFGTTDPPPRIVTRPLEIGWAPDLKVADVQKRTKITKLKSEQSEISVGFFTRADAAETEKVMDPHGSGSPPKESTEVDVDLASEISRLSQLSDVDYDRERKAAAHRLRVRVETLDRQVLTVRNTSSEGGEDAGLYRNTAPYPESVDGTQVLTDLWCRIKRHVVISDQMAATVVLWMAYSWAHDCFSVSCMIYITAPDKRAGKTRLLECFGFVCRRSLTISGLTPASMFRLIDRDCPTLLIDEVDTIIDRNEDLRGLLNSGHTRTGARVIRTVRNEPQTFSTWCPKVLAGIGVAHPTIMDRSIVLSMKRKKATDTIERLDEAAQDEFRLLASKLSRWSRDATAELRRTHPEIPDGLNDRQRDCWRPLLAIADLIGGEWPALARDAASKISKETEDTTVSPGVELLSDIHEVFDASGLDRISSQDLLSKLVADPLKLWATVNGGRAMNPRQLADRLKEYGICPRTIRTASGSTPKGYVRSDFEEAFASYLETKQG